MRTSLSKRWVALLIVLTSVIGMPALAEYAHNIQEVSSTTVEQVVVDAGELELDSIESHVTVDDRSETSCGRLPEGLTEEFKQSDQEQEYDNEKYGDAGNLAIRFDSFPDAAFREYIGRFDTDGDGILSSVECKAVTQIKKRYAGITSLKGVSYFTNLQYLDVRGNSISGLDLSKNTELLEIECSENRLTDLHIGNLAKLKKLCCYKNNLKRLNTSKNTSLEYLDCQGNGMIDLYLGENFNLDTVICFDNQLPRLDLRYVENIMYLDCWNNKIKNLNIAGHAVLRQLRVYGNPIKTLDLENCNELQSALEGKTPIINSNKVEWGNMLSIPVNTKLLLGKEVVYRPGKPTSVSLNYRNKSMKVGETCSLVATLKPIGVVSKCTWTSNKTSVATVNSSGVVTAKAKGTATITVKTANGKKATCKITVSNLAGNRIEVKDFIGKDAEDVSRRLGLYFHRECYQDAEETIYVFPSVYDYDRVYQIGLLNGNKKHCIEGVYVGMDYSTARNMLISKGYVATVEDMNGTTIYVYDNGSRIIDHILIDGRVEGLYIRSYDY